MQTSPADITVRPTTPADLDAMVAVHTEARTAYYRAGGLDDAEICTPAEHADRIAGWARAIRSTDRTTLCAVREADPDASAVLGILAIGTTGELHQIHVRPDNWGRGIGSLLHDAYVRTLRDASIPYGTLSARAIRNPRARLLHPPRLAPRRRAHPGPRRGGLPAAAVGAGTGLMNRARVRPSALVPYPAPPQRP
ncbi:GNAT family N-acetyltransferase [Actinacidiphila oryziradicis]|uniref:GNAT family N-acetyltransferase n=1 Tax=Actinacidiphila oryziradicis TaxID=2571141 RepID=UPI0023F2E22C|nr:GNAT family N-acetyltransferase [Actinacidiphila oryziradicis]